MVCVYLLIARNMLFKELEDGYVIFGDNWMNYKWILNDIRGQNLKIVYKKLKLFDILNLYNYKNMNKI